MQAINDFDFAILDALQGIHNTFLNYFFAVFTYLGEAGILWIVLTFALLFYKNTSRLGLITMTGLLSEGLFNELIIKNIVRRPRPFKIHPYVDTFVVRPNSYSFPSGHTCLAFAAATMLFLYNKKWGIAAYITAVLIAFSRNYFYIHYPTDVIAGMLEGILIGVVNTFVMNKIFERLDSKKTAEEV